MQIDLYTQVLLWGFLLSLVFGAVANKTNFCTMGAVADWVNFGDQNRLRSWALAIAVAVIGVGALEYLSVIDMTLTTNNETANPPYRVADFVWLRHLVGGLMFGIGMTLSSGCGNKTLVRLGEGNLKSLVVLLVMALSASAMLFTSFDYTVFLQWMLPISIDFTDYGIASQNLARIFAGLSGVGVDGTVQFTIALMVGGLLLVWIFLRTEFRTNRELVAAGLIIGVLVVTAWYVTAGPTGQALLEELDFADERPYAAGAQSLSFIAPTAHLAQYAYQGFNVLFLTFGVVVVFGVVLGSFLYTVIFRRVRLEWFASKNDFVMHVVGAVLMGMGGILAMGCTIGQGISGAATLALGSILTVVSIVTGSALTMKYQYYLMMREDD